MLNASKHEARPKISSPNPLRRLRRAVEDYDFDRLEVEAQQCVELTSTNRSFGLIIKLSQTVFERVVKQATPCFSQYCSACGSGFLLTALNQKRANLYASQILLLVAPQCFRRRCQIY